MSRMALLREQCHCLGRMALLRAVGTGTYRREQCHLGFIKEQKNPCSSQSFGCHDETWYQLKHGLQVGYVQGL